MHHHAGLKNQNYMDLLMLLKLVLIVAPEVFEQKLLSEYPIRLYKLFSI